MRPGSGCGYREALLSRKKCSPLTVRDVVRGTISVAGLGGPSRPVDILPFHFCCCVYTLCLFGMNASSQTCFCVMRVVEVGQYLVTKDTGNLRQFRPVACREYTIPRDDPASEAKGWIQGNTRIGPVLEVTTSFRPFKYGIEIRIWSVNQDNSQSWVRKTYGTTKYVVESIQDNTEIPVDPQEEQVPQTIIKVVAARSKAKAKPQPRVLVGTTATIPIHERRWIDIEPSEQNLASYDLSKKVINLLRHNQTLQREDDGAIEFYKIKFYLRNHHSQIQLWSDDRWKACLAAGGGSKRRYQYCSDDSGTILYLRALQGHSGSNLIDPTLQDNVVIESGIFHYIHHVGCAFNLHSIINNGLIPGGQDLSRRQTVFFLHVDPRDENHKNPEHIDFSVPRRARYVQGIWSVICSVVRLIIDTVC